jgi:hypothetical protein
VRSAKVFEFLVKYPWGISAISGYRRAARHFGLHTREDPSTVGNDSWCLFVHKDPRKLRQVVAQLSALDPSNSNYDVDEWSIKVGSGVHWFWHDWKQWDIEADENAVKNLGWTRAVEDRGDGTYRVTIRRRAGRGRRSAGSRSR